MTNFLVVFFGDFLHGKPFGLQAIVGTENVRFLFSQRIAYHREYLVKQFTTLHFGVDLASSQSLFTCIYSRLFINHPKFRHKVTDLSPIFIRND